MKAGYFLMAGLISSLLLSSCSPSKTDLPIIGGEVVAASDEIRKSIVAVYDANEGGLCTGTLMAPNLVVTAAHCIGTDLTKMFVYFGTELSDDSPSRAIDKIEISPYWAPNQDRDFDRGDIALVRFAGPPPEGYKPALFITTSLAKNLKAGTDVIVAGYGMADAFTGDGAGILRQTLLKIEDPYYTNSEVLVNQSRGSSVCHGDSGGPAFVLYRDQYYFWGVISRGVQDPDNTCATFAAFTRVAYYRIWLERMADKLSTSLTKSRF